MSKPRNNAAVAMMKRYASTTTTMKSRAQKRAKDARKSWKREEY